VNGCQEPQNGIAAKADALASLYERYIPRGLKEREQYGKKEKYKRRCATASYDRTYPLHSGWLLAVGAYNAGPRVVDALAHYNEWTPSDVDSGKTFKDFTPANMIESLYWSGKYNQDTDRIDFTTLGGSPMSWLWFKECVVQRHIARVIQHVTLPGVPNFVDSLEGNYKCAKSTFDPDGKLIKSGVPPFRQASSGTKTPAEE
jgi:hypothetical protein